MNKPISSDQIVSDHTVELTHFLESAAQHLATMTSSAITFGLVDFGYFLSMATLMALEASKSNHLSPNKE